MKPTYKEDSEIEIEKCMQTIDHILANTYLNDNQYIDWTVAHKLYKLGNTEWTYNDDVSGPQISGISEIALTRIAENEIPYSGEFQVVIEFRNGTKYFKKHPIRDKTNQSILPYNSIISLEKQN
ncbi:MAG: hypothetical protein ACP5OA_07450 [Candidatus Woesearchaeota archaeon]